MEGPPWPTLRRVASVVDTLSEWSGRVFAWIIIPLVVSLTYEVLARYAFNAPTIWAYDLSYML
jgi:TRAP-type mannitol/chloroaromatic compound transport system permease small subunit